MNWWHIPGPIGAAIDGYSQYRRDQGKDYKPLQQVGRIGVVIIEGQVISWASTSFAGAAVVAFSGTTIGAPVAGGGVYVAANITGSRILDQYNQTRIFPYIQQ
jgi:hypothetical protein